MNHPESPKLCLIKTVESLAIVELPKASHRTQAVRRWTRREPPHGTQTPPRSCGTTQRAHLLTSALTWPNAVGSIEHHAINTSVQQKTAQVALREVQFLKVKKQEHFIMLGLGEGSPLRQRLNPAVSCNVLQSGSVSCYVKGSYTATGEGYFFDLLLVWNTFHQCFVVHYTRTQS